MLVELRKSASLQIEGVLQLDVGNEVFRGASQEFGIPGHLHDEAKARSSFLCMAKGGTRELDDDQERTSRGAQETTSIPEGGDSQAPSSMCNPRPQSTPPCIHGVRLCNALYPLAEGYASEGSTSIMQLARHTSCVH